MAIDRWRPFATSVEQWDPFPEIQSEMNRLFDGFFGRPRAIAPGPESRVWMPVGKWRRGPPPGPLRRASIPQGDQTMAKVIGIDLGTTNSVVAIVEGGNPTVIANQEGSRLTPSVAAFTKDGEILVGQVAKRQAITNPENTIFSIKRFMGRRYDEVLQEIKLVPYKVVKAPNGDARVEVRGKQSSPPEISAMILRKLKEAAEAYLGEKVTQAVITVPAYFNDAQRQATKDAGKIAGLEVLRIINEPTAAAPPYGLGKKKGEKNAGYHPGGGTFHNPTLEPVQDAGASASDINEVILVGGQTRMPKVQDVVKTLFGKEPHKGVNPDEVVGVGAAVQGAILARDPNIQSMVLLDVTPLSLGIETLGGVMTKLIERNTTIPTKKSEVFTTAADSQPSVEVHVLQGERPMARDNRTLGRFHLDGIPPAPRGVPQIEVTFDIDVNGILNVSAQDKATGKQQKITITSSSGLSKDEIDKMVKEAEANAADDARHKQEIEVRNQTDSLVYSTERTLSEHGSKLAETDRKAIDDALAEAKEALKTDDLDRMKRAQETLSKAAQKLGEIMYREAQAQQSGQGAGSQAGPQAGGPGRPSGPKEGEGRDAAVQDLRGKKQAMRRDYYPVLGIAAT